MAQITGAFTIEVPLDRIAEQVAELVVARLHAAARQATGGGSHVYDRDEPDGPQGSGRPWTGPRHEDDDAGGGGS